MVFVAGRWRWEVIIAAKLAEIVMFYTISI